MSRHAMKGGIAVFCLIGVLAFADVAYQVFRAVEDSRVHCGNGLGGQACRTIRHGFTHIRLVAAVDGLAVAVAATVIAATLAWLRNRASSAERQSH